MDNPKFIVLNQKEESFSIQRANIKTDGILIFIHIDIFLLNLHFLSNTYFSKRSSLCRLDSRKQYGRGKSCYSWFSMNNFKLGVGRVERRELFHTINKLIFTWHGRNIIENNNTIMFPLII